MAGGDLEAGRPEGSRGGTSTGGTSGGGAPGDAAKRDGAKRDGAKRDGAKRDGASEDGASGNRASGYARPGDAQPGDGESGDGASGDGASGDGAGREAGYLRPALAGASATLSGIGLARFAYVLLFPVMVMAGWIDGGEAGLIGAANLAGYLAGVMSGRVLARRVGVARALDAGMALTALAFAACAWNGGVLWLAAWRGVAGASGGILMALAGPSVQMVVPAARRGAAGGVVISGVGTGIVATAVAIPFLLEQGIAAAWLGLSGLVLGLWAFARRRWPAAAVPPRGGPRGGGAAPGRALTLVLAYGLAGAGMVPHMVYLADLAVRGHGYAFAVAGWAWLLFGLGALTGTLAAGRAVDALGGAAGVRIWLALQAAALLLVPVPAVPALLAGAFLGGFGGIGVTAVALARARELAGDAAGVVWQQATASYAVAQAGTAFALALLFERTGAHGDLFLAGLAFSLAAVAVSLRSK